MRVNFTDSRNNKGRASGAIDPSCSVKIRMCNILLKRQISCFIGKGDKLLKLIIVVSIVTCRTVKDLLCVNRKTFIYRILLQRVEYGQWLNYERCGSTRVMII